MDVKKTLIAIILSLSMTNFGHALEFDATIDDEIRKNYNPNKLVNDTGVNNSALDKSLQADVIPPSVDINLPELPNITKTGTTTKTPDVKTTVTTPKYTPYRGGNIRIKEGTSLDVISIGAISDWQTAGTQVKFINKKNIYGKGFTIPANTIFNGEIVESHLPQITCNGGLVVIRVTSMIYKNQKVPINAYVTRANDSKIFFNNIKGERNYLKTMWKKGNWGRTLFGRMFNLTLNLGGEGSTFILSPFPLAYGTICLGANAITSPITAFFSKGGHVSIPANSHFRIKLTDEVWVN